MSETRILTIKKKVLGKNDEMAQDLRDEFARNGVFVANLVNMNLAYQFTSRMFARAVLSYLDISRNEALYTNSVNENDNDLFTQFLFSYKVNPQTLLYLGYSDDRYGEGEELMRQVDRTLFLKVGYAWLE